MKSKSNSAQTLNELKLKTQLFRCYWNRGRSCHLCWWLEVAAGATRRTINKRQRQYITKKVNILLTAFKLYTQRKWSQRADVFKSCLSSIWCQKWVCLLECNFFLSFLSLLSCCSPSLTFFFSPQMLPPHFLSNTILTGGRLNKFKACPGPCACPVRTDTMQCCHWSDAVEMM